MSIFVSTFFLPSTFARDYQTWGLPDGAKARFGKGWISDIAYSPDGTQLAVASSIGIWIYDTETLAEVELLTGHTGYVNALAYSPDGKTLISGGEDSTTRVWDAHTGELQHTLEAHGSGVKDVAFSPDSKMFGSVDSSASGWATRRVSKIFLWDADTMQLVHTFPLRAVTCLAFSSDSKWVAVGGSLDGISIRDVNTGEDVGSARSTRNAITSIAFSSDGITLAIGSVSNVELWGAHTLKHWQTLGTLKEAAADVNAVAFSPDGEVLASAGDGNLIQLWDTLIGENLQTLEGHTEPVQSVSFSPDGNTLASASLSEIIFWDINTGEQKQIITGHTRNIHSIALSDDDGTLASAYEDRTVQLWDVNRQERQQTVTVPIENPRFLRPINLSFSPDGAALAIATGQLYLWDLISREFLWSYEVYVHTTFSGILLFSPDGTTLTVDTNHTDLLLLDVGTGKLIQKYNIAGASDILPSPDGQFLATVGGGAIHLWHLRTERKIRTLGGGRVYSAAYAPDGSTIAGGVDNEVWFWKVRSGEVLRKFTGHTEESRHYVHTVAFSSNGKTLVSASTDGSICLWNVDTGECKDTFMGHTGALVDVAYTPDGRTLASGSSDGTVLLWELMPPEFPQHAVDVNQDGVVNILDLTLIATNFGEQGENTSDVNGDGVVNILDLTLVAAAFGDIAAAPIYGALNLENMPTKADVAAWLQQAQQANLTDPTFQRGILILEQLLAVLTPKETMLLANYPNPFNPETWIPYQLADPADVTLTIYDIQGRAVRTLDLGHQRAGTYHDRSRAAYWDGKNAQGESVASGVYFYTLTAGDFSATRKLLIRK